MTSECRVIAIVPARAGSKGFPDKNVARIAGKTLLEHAVACGVQAQLITDVYVSTDSQRYLDLALAVGAKSVGLRPAELASDSAKSIDVIKHVISSIKTGAPSHVVLLQPTSPVRTPDLVDECIRLSIASSLSVVSVAKVIDPHPYKLKKIVDGALCPFIDGTSSEVPRQELPPAYELTGSIYVSTVGNIMENNSLFSVPTKPFVTSAFVNIDTEQDFRYLEFLVEKGFVRLHDGD